MGSTRMLFTVTLETSKWKCMRLFCVCIWEWIFKLSGLSLFVFVCVLIMLWCLYSTRCLGTCLSRRHTLCISSDYFCDMLLRNCRWRCATRHRFRPQRGEKQTRRRRNQLFSFPQLCAAGCLYFVSTLYGEKLYLHALDAVTAVRKQCKFVDISAFLDTAETYNWNGICLWFYVVSCE